MIIAKNDNSSLLSNDNDAKQHILFGWSEYKTLVYSTIILNKTIVVRHKDMRHPCSWKKISKENFSLVARQPM